jgi:hypothetical protein
MKLPKLLFGSSHASYHALMLVIALAVLGVVIFIAEKVQHL